MRPGRAARRLITIPVMLGWHLLVLVCSPALLLVAALVGVVTRSTLPMRTVMVLVAYAELELAAVARITRLRASGDDSDWQALVRWFVASTYAVTRRILDVCVCGSKTDQRGRKTSPAVQEGLSCWRDTAGPATPF